MATRDEIESTRQTVEGLAMMARKLGYKNSFGQLTFDNGASASDLFDFFDDNPGAIGAVIEWVLESGCNRDGSELGEEKEETEEEDEFEKYISKKYPK